MISKHFSYIKRYNCLDSLLVYDTEKGKPYTSERKYAPLFNIDYYAEAFYFRGKFSHSRSKINLNVQIFHI